MNGSSFDHWTKTLASRRSRRSFLHGAAVAGVALPVARGQQSASAKPEKVTLCHRTGSSRNPFRIITVSSNATKAHLDHGDFEAMWCGDDWSCEPCPCILLPLFCNSAEVCPTGATQFCPGGLPDPTSSDQAKAACDACFGEDACVHNDLDCSGAGWLLNFSPEPQPELHSPVFGYETGLCIPEDPQPPGRVYAATNSVPELDYGLWGTATCL